jgi:hypothetical protein
MKWIEIITLRSTSDDLEALDIKSLVVIKGDIRSGKLEQMKIYRRCGMDTDLSVHLRWNTEWVEATGSKIALHLMQLLKENGLVNHSIWREEECN